MQKRFLALAIVITILTMGLCAQDMTGAAKKAESGDSEKKTREMHITEYFDKVNEKIDDAEFNIEQAILEIVKNAKYKVAKNDPRLLEVFGQEFSDLEQEHNRIVNEFEKAKEKILELKKRVIMKSMVEAQVLEIQDLINKKSPGDALSSRFYELKISLERIANSDEFPVTEREKETYKKALEELEKIQPALRQADKEGDPIPPEKIEKIIEILNLEKQEEK